MPSLERPETDLERRQLLRIAKAKYDTTAPADRAFETANPANTQTLPANVPAGGSVTVNFSF